MPINDVKQISDLLSELMESQNLTTEKIASTTDIPLRFVVALKNGELKTLPAEPYVRGYLTKIAGLLKVEPELLINSYRESIGVVRSGKNDKLPSNTFVKIPFKRGALLATAIIAIITITILVRFNSVFGIPELNVEIPATSTFDSIYITGSVKPGDQVTLNDESISVDANGNFEQKQSLNPGINTLIFKVKRFLGKEITVTKAINYEQLPETVKTGTEKKITPAIQ